MLKNNIRVLISAVHIDQCLEQSLNNTCEVFKQVKSLVWVYHIIFTPFLFMNNYIFSCKELFYQLQCSMCRMKP